VDAVIIRHARNLPEDIVAKSWRVVGTPAEAYASVLGRS
jgi:hypothetical protein